MNRILTILVLLVTVTVLGAATGSSVCYADEAGAIAAPADNVVKSGDLDATLSGPSGDPDGMGTGNGLTDDDDDPFIRENGDLDGLGEAEALLYLLSLIELLAI